MISTRTTLCAVALTAAVALPACGSDDDDVTATAAPVDARVVAAEQEARRHPQDPAAWAALARQHFLIASEDGYSDKRGKYNAVGRTELRATDRAWQRHLALDPAPPDEDMARLMVQVYGEAGLQQYAKAVRAQEVVVDARADLPRAQRSPQFAQLAVLAYQAKDVRRGDLASDRAVELAPAADRRTLRGQLRQIRWRAR